MDSLKRLFSEKTVRFNDNIQINLLYDWFGENIRARQGEWEQAARDRERFHLRIQRVGKIINPVLEKYLKNQELFFNKSKK